MFVEILQSQEKFTRLLQFTMAISILASKIGSLPRLITGGELWPAFFILLAVFGGSYFMFHSKSRKLRHIPILAPELGTRGRKKAFRWQAKQSLERGYREVRTLARKPTVPMV
jgi:hypothetical protein